MGRTLLVSTCGTSLLSNGASDEMRKFLNRTSNANESELSQDDRFRIDERLKDQSTKLAAATVAVSRQLSAELNGILGYYNSTLPSSSEDVHVLLHTDTYQGVKVGEVLQQWLQGSRMNAQLQLVKCLTTKSVANFRDGIASLIGWCEVTLPGYRHSQYRIVFNLSGGFKSLQGFMQTLGMFYADELVYIFESNDELLRIPRLPVEIESSVQQAIRSHLRTFRRLSPQGATIPREECVGIPETLIYELGDDADLSSWGRLVWERSKPKIYQEEILGLLSKKLALSPTALRTAQQLPNDRKAIFNERMDDLSIYLDSNRANCPRRLDFKSLRGNPCPPSTHECDLWADGDAWRAFGHFEGERFMVDRIGSGLH